MKWLVRQEEPSVGERMILRLTIAGPSQGWPQPAVSQASTGKGSMLRKSAGTVIAFEASPIQMNRM